MRLAPFLAAGSLLLGASALPAQQTFHDPLNGFSVDLPADWRQMPDSAVDRISRLASRATGSPVRYVGGYQPAKSRWSEFPYLLIQAAEAPAISEERFVGFLTGGEGRRIMEQAAERVKGSLPVREVTMQQPSWDAASHILWLPSHTDTGQGLTIESLSAFHLSRRGFVALHFYDTTPEALQPTLSPIVATLRFDPGAEYQAPADRGLGSGVMVGAIIGALIGVLGTVLALRRRKATQG